MKVKVDIDTALLKELVKASGIENPAEAVETSVRWQLQVLNENKNKK